MANLYQDAVKAAKKSGTSVNRRALEVATGGMNSSGSAASTSSSGISASEMRRLQEQKRYQQYLQQQAAAERKAAHAAAAANPSATSAPSKPIYAPAVAAANTPSLADGAANASAASKTTYIDGNGEKKSGVVAPSANAVSQTPINYTDAGGKYRTKIFGADGKTYTGYIFNGAAYYDNGDRLAVGDSVVGADGTVYTMGSDKTSKAYDWNSDEYKKWLEGAAEGQDAFRIHNDTYTGFKAGYDTDQYGQNVRNGNITLWPDGTIAVYDGFGNIMGRFDSAGTWHVNSEGEGRNENDPLFQSWEKAARNQLDAIGVKFTGNGMEWNQRDHYPVSGGENKWLDQHSYLKSIYPDYTFVGNKEQLKTLPAGTKVFYYGSDPIDESALPDGLIMRGRGSMGAHVTGDATGSSYDFMNERATGLAAGLRPGEGGFTGYEYANGSYGTEYRNSAGEAGLAGRQTGAGTPAQAGTPTQQRDMMASEAERQRQAQEAAEAARRQQEAQIAAMTPEDNAQMAQLRDQLAQVDALLEQARSSNDDAYALQLEQLRNRIQLQIDSLNEQYQGINRQLYVDYMMGRRDLPQQLAAMGYTGGLRESSLLNLQNNYEGQLAENERSRLAGIRDIESGGLDRELTLGIENIKDNQQAQDKAYDRATAVRAQMLSQLNRIEDLSREDAQQARKEAQDQINAYLAAGGTADGIPASLLNISGYSSGYVSAIAQQTARKLAQQQASDILKAGGTIPGSLASAAGYGAEYTYALDEARRRQEAQAQADAILRAGGTLPYDIAQTAGYQTNYADAMTEARRRQEAQAQATAILQAGGVVPADIAAAAGYSGSYTSALEAARQQQLAQEQANAIWKAGGTVPGSLAGAAGYSTDYADALNGLLGGGAQTKPVLTVTQVNDAIKKGILSDQVLQAYQYYYGQPYQQAATPYTPYYTPPVTTPPVTTPTPTPTPTPTVTNNEARNLADKYLSEYATAGGSVPWSTWSDAVQKDLGNKVKNAGLDPDLAVEVMDLLRI